MLLTEGTNVELKEIYVPDIKKRWWPFPIPKAVQCILA